MSSAFTGETHSHNFYAHVDMDDFDQEAINEELIEFAIRESIQDACKAPCPLQTNRYEGPNG